MLRTRSVARWLWTLAAAATVAGCGRVGFGEDAVAIVAPPLELVTECGVAPASTAVEIVNDGTTALVIEQATATGGFTVSTPMPLVIQPGATGALGVVPPAAVIGTDVAKAVKAGVLTIVTNEEDAPVHAIDLAARVVGAQITFIDGFGAPVNLTFSSNNACPPGQNVFVMNSGNRPASLSPLPASRFVVTTLFNGPIDGGISGQVTVSALTSGPCSGTETIAYTVTGSSCSSTPAVFDASFTITGLNSCSCS